MKLILSTLALGTAVVSPSAQHEGSTQAGSAAGPIGLVTVALTTDAAPAAQDSEELKRAAAALEAQLADLRAELEGMRAHLAEQETSGRKSVDAERATGRRARRPEARDRREEARRRAIVERTRANLGLEAEHRNGRALENAEGRHGSIMVLKGDGQHVIQLHDDGDLAEGIAELRGADGPAGAAWAIADGRGEPRKVVTRRWRPAPRSEGPGEKHEVHVLRGPGGPIHMEQELLRHGPGGQTIHIIVEKGDLYIGADGVRSRAGHADPSSGHPHRTSKARERTQDAEARPRRIEREKQEAPGKAEKKTRALKKKAASRKAERRSGASKKGKKKAPRKTKEGKGGPKKTKERNGATKKAKEKSSASKKGKKEAPRKAKERRAEPKKTKEKNSDLKKAKGKDALRKAPKKDAQKKDARKKTKGKKTKERFSLLGDGDAEVFLAKPETQGAIVHGFSGEGVAEALEAKLQSLLDGGEIAELFADEDGDIEVFTEIDVESLPLDTLGALKQIVVLDGSSGLSGDIDALIEEGELGGIIAEAIGEAMRKVGALDTDGEGIELRTRVIINGEEVDHSGDGAEDHEESSGFVFSPSLIDGPAEVTTELPRALSTSYRSPIHPADADFAALAREVRRMRTELAELRAHVMSTPVIPTTGSSRGLVSDVGARRAVAPARLAAPAHPAPDSGAR